MNEEKTMEQKSNRNIAFWLANGVILLRHTHPVFGGQENTVLGKRMSIILGGGSNPGWAAGDQQSLHQAGFAGGGGNPGARRGDTAYRDSAPPGRVPHWSLYQAKTNHCSKIPGRF